MDLPFASQHLYGCRGKILKCVIINLVLKCAEHWNLLYEKMKINWGIKKGSILQTGRLLKTWASSNYVFYSANTSDILTSYLFLDNIFK